MVDFGTFRPERPFEQLVLEKLRPGDIATHMYVAIPDHAAVPLFDSEGKLLPYLARARSRGVRFDVGHGFESFPWDQVVPAVRQGWLPDTISTDLYARSMNAALKDMPTLMSKFLSLGVPLAEVVKMSTLAPAETIRRPELGHLGVGAGADLAVLGLQNGDFGFLDVRNLRRSGSQTARVRADPPRGARRLRPERPRGRGLARAQTRERTEPGRSRSDPARAFSLRGADR